MKKISILLITIVFCNTVFAQPKFIKHFNIWIGNWEMITAKDITIEKWVIKNDSTLIGKSTLIKPNGDSTLQESIELSMMNNEIFYIPKVVNQNNNQPVPFKLVEFNNEYFVFENKAHDFPQRIIYDFTVKDKLVATIEGVQKKIRKKIDYHFIKLH